MFTFPASLTQALQASRLLLWTADFSSATASPTWEYSSWKASEFKTAHVAPELSSAAKALISNWARWWMPMRLGTSRNSAGQSSKSCMRSAAEVSSKLPAM